MNKLLFSLPRLAFHSPPKVIPNPAWYDFKKKSVPMISHSNVVLPGFLYAVDVVIIPVQAIQDINLVQT